MKIIKKKIYFRSNGSETIREENVMYRIMNDVECIRQDNRTRPYSIHIGRAEGETYMNGIWSSASYLDECTTLSLLSDIHSVVSLIFIILYIMA